jgi:hypothetical protein
VRFTSKTKAAPLRFSRFRRSVDMTVVNEWDDIWIQGTDGGEYLATVVSVSDPYKSRNILEDGKPAYGRQYVLFIAEDEE